MATSKTDKGMSKTTQFLVIIMVLVVGFIAGTRSHELLGAIAPIFGFKVETGTLDLRSVQKTYQELKANYDGDLDERALIEGASRGLVEAAGDPYTVYMDAKEAEDFEKDISGEIGGGIGAEIGMRNDYPTVIRVLPGNPAEAAGVKAGDVIASINDQVTSGWNAEKAAGEIRGEVGTTVKLGLVRGTDTKDFTITRQKVSNPSVQSTVEDRIGILTLTRFDEATATQARQAAKGFRQQGIKGVVLDLRGNGGGYLDAAQDVASLWLKDKVIVTEQANGRVTETLKAKGEAVLAGVPTVVLINGGSASASEIVAGALQDHKAATVIGEKSFGKGTVQRILNLGAGTKLKVTIARWFTPNGKNITKEGINPDATVELKAEDVDAGRDPQLEAAKVKIAS